MIYTDTHWDPGNVVYGDSPKQTSHSTLIPDIYAIMQSNNLYAYCMNNPLMFMVIVLNRVD